MWSRGRPGSARLLLLVTSVRSPADSRVVASEVIGQPGEPHIATSTGQRSATLCRRHGLRPFRAMGGSLRVVSDVVCRTTPDSGPKGAMRRR